jgi:hypothetical protein
MEQKYIMIPVNNWLICLIITITCSLSFAYVINSEFNNPSEPADSVYAKWASAGSNAVIDTVFVREIDITNIEPIVCFNYTSSETDTTLFASAIPNDGLDDQGNFETLIDFILLRRLNVSEHIRIFIPRGTYNFSDQIVMHSNISFKGAGSDATTLRFLIETDSTMTAADCRKDAILVAGSGLQQPQLIRNVGIENVKIIREKGVDFSNDQIYNNVGGHCSNGNTYPGYWGNNIAIRRATNCWVRGVESNNTFRNHVTLEFSEHVTISGVYFYDANKYRDGGFGYGVGLWDSSKNLVENSIFRHLRHAVTISDSCWYNVIAYNYIREQHSTQPVPVLGEITTHWSDIAIHGEATNTYYHNRPSNDYVYNDNRKPYYNLVEGNDLEYLCVDATHLYNGTNNTFLRNRVTEQIHVQGSDGFASPFVGLGIDAVVLICADPVSAMAWVLLTIPTFYKYTCVHCLALKINDIIDSDLDNFRNQPRQLFVNNYAREYNWWRCQILDYPVRMHSEVDQFQINTYKRYVNFFGKKKGKVLSEYTPAYTDGSYYHDQEIAPEYWPNTMAWPYYTSQEGNPASYRWHNSNKKTFGPGDPAGYYSITTISSNTTFTEDQIIAAGSILVINPGLTIKFAPDKKLTINGSLQALGTEELPIVFTCSDSSQTWYGIKVAGTNEAALPNIELSNCTISKVSTGALTMYQYNDALIDRCTFTQNTDFGAIYSDTGQLKILDSSIQSNTSGIYSA